MDWKKTTFTGKRKQWPTKDASSQEDIVERLEHLEALVEQCLNILEEIAEAEDCTDWQSDPEELTDLS